MRITNQIIQRSSIARLQDGLQSVDRARDQISSGRRILAMSDDPSAASEVVRTGSSLRAVGQFQRNVNQAAIRSTAEEQALDQLTRSLDRGVEVAVVAASPSASAEARATAKAEIDQTLSYAVTLANTKQGDDFLFGGTRGAEQPLKLPTSATDPFTNLVDANGQPINPSGAIGLEIRDGRIVTPNHNATEIFLDTNALQSLRDLSIALGNNDVPGMNSALASINNANDRVQTLLGTQGARATEYAATIDHLGAQELSLSKYQSDLRDIDAEKAIIELSGRQTGYQAAMAATTRVLGLSLANYLV